MRDAEQIAQYPRAMGPAKTIRRGPVDRLLARVHGVLFTANEKQRARYASERRRMREPMARPGA